MLFHDNTEPVNAFSEVHGLFMQINGGRLNKHLHADSAFIKLANQRGSTESGFVSFQQAKHANIDYMIGYYSDTRPHQYNGGLTPNESERQFWKSSKTVATFVDHYKPPTHMRSNLMLLKLVSTSVGPFHCCHSPFPAPLSSRP
ncbi:hypothetical protein GCM10011502_27900 [Oceanisphaera marina]|uniref:Integrase catalytic domain-containing protein n=1 Tax=Oceanisphaera marina TaxID=2017550 RepID=A0ABQ1IUX7_9GAMM|nr:hypothetical protein GCM10011502_27900 [Oceanisphaera marina]